jgi:hypothetical protein
VLDTACGIVSIGVELVAVELRTIGVGLANPMNVTEGITVGAVTATLETDGVTVEVATAEVVTV